MSATASLLAASVILAPALPRLQTDLAVLTKASVDLRQRLMLPHVRNAPVSRKLVVRFASAPDAARLAALEAAGITFERAPSSLGGGLLHIGTCYGAHVAYPTGFATLVAATDVVELLPPSPHKVPATPMSSNFDKVDRLTSAFNTWPRRNATGRRHLGDGILIADIDSGIDQYHPLFFRADGGFYEWIDVDGNDAFDIGADAVDLDNDGTITPDEILRRLGGDVVDWSGQPIDSAPGFVTGRHWLYADTNGNGRRDYGPADGYDDSAPAFGEPLFIADDIDQNGVLEVGERLLRLQTSKIKMIIREYSDTLFVRGVNLTDSPVHNQVDHGTGVAGILIGGVYGRTQILGVAPEAELIMIDNNWAPGDPMTPARTRTGLIDLARQLGVDLLVHEYGTHIHNYGDGADPWEEQLDTLSSQGMVQVTANHNFAGYNGNAIFTIPAGATHDVGMDVYVVNGAPIVAYLTIRWRDGNWTDLVGTAVTPGGTEITMDATSTAGGIYPTTAGSTSSRGTSMLGTTLVNWTGTDYDTLPGGRWQFRLQNTTAADIEVFFTIGDDTGYAYYIQLVADITDATTMAHPSTTDSAISVGASVGNTPDAGEAQGALKGFSGRGPRIDGVRGVDIVAPEDDYTAVSSVVGTHGDYQLFAGTSGALPQVAGAIALLLQAEPGLTPAEVKDRIVSSATADAQTGAVPNPSWGGGRLAIFELLYGTSATFVPAPTASFSAPSPLYAGRPVALDASASSDPVAPLSQLTFRWDLDYDGTIDGALVGDPTYTTTFPDIGPVWVKLEVENPRGLSTQTIAALDIVADPGPGGAGGTGGGAGGGGGAGTGTGGTGSGGDGSGGALGNPGGGCVNAGDGCVGASTPGLLGAALLLGLLRRRRRR